MARTQRDGRRANRLGAIEREILEELSLGDLLVGFLCSAHSTRRMDKIAHERATQRYRRRKAVERLMSQGYVGRKGGHASINAAGRRLLGQTISNVRATLKDKKWDGKWRIITFDIPERLRRVRNQIRDILKRAGFVRLQNSTWIFPHDCEELSQLIKGDPRLSRHVLYGILEKIEDDERLQRIFSLAAYKK